MVSVLWLIIAVAPEMAELQVPPTVELSCEGARCSAVVSVTVTNPTQQVAELHAINARCEESGAMESVRPSEVKLAPGASWSRDVTLSRAGEWWLSLEVSFPGQHWMNAPRARVVVTNPVRDRAMAQCRACRGDWGPHGMLGIEGCICQAKDAGKVCHDARECEGECVFQRVELVRRERKQCDAQGRCVVSLALGRRVGRCSEKIGDFGCASLLDDGEGELPPRTLPLHSGQVCRD